MKRAGGRAILLGPVRSTLEQVLAHRGARRALRVGVDGGVERWLKLGIVPDIAVGDWDSLRSRRSLERVARAGGRVVTLSGSKDESDLAHALGLVARAGAREVVCLGVTGGRPDHQLATLAELSSAAAGGRFAAVTALGPEGEYHFLSKRIPRWSAQLAPGTTVSVFALSDRARGVTLRGMAYPLRNAELRPTSRGLSNVVRARRISVSLSSGRIVVIIPK
jgi:thiamine pyrophosphokinase